MQDNINKLYNVLKNDGYEDLGTEEKFRNFVNDTTNVKKLYGVLKNDGYEDLGTEDQFISFVMPKQQASKPQGMIATAIQAPEPPASIAKPENGLPLQKFNVAEQNQKNAEKLRMQQENTPFMRQQRATEQQTTAMNQPAFPDIEAPQLSRSIGDDRQKYKGMISQAIKDAVGAKSETALADAMKATRQELARQGYDMDALQDSGLLSEGIDNVIIPTAEAAVTKGRKIIDKVFDDALTRAKAARSRHIEPLRYAGAQSDLQMLTNELAGERAYQQEIDPDKLQAQLINAIDKDGLQETFKEVYRQASKYGINPKEYFNTYVAPHLKENAARALDKFMTDQYMPKDDAEYILSGFSNSITGMLSDWLTKSAKQNAYKQMALSKYDASTGTQIAREAVGLLSSAPEFVVSGGAASAVTKKVCGSAIQNMVAKGFTRMQAQRILTAELANKFGQRVAERMVQSSISGSANFATLESMSEAARQLRDDDFNAGKIALKGVEGAGKGAIFGAVSGGYAGATSELTGATKIISNFLGIPANGLSLTLSSNAINEISKMMGGEDELMEVDAEGNSKRKSFMQQWADNTLLDLMMRGTSPHNLNVITKEGRTDISNRIRSFFSPLSESQQIIGKSFGSGISEEGQDRLMQITGTDNLRDALMSNVPKASDMPSLPFQAGRIDGKTRSRSVDDLLREEQRNVMQQNWDKIMHDRELSAADKAKLCAIMGAKYHPNPSVTHALVHDENGREYIEYRDAAGMLNERVAIEDADISRDVFNRIRMNGIYGKTAALGKRGEYAVAANATRYAMKPDAEGNVPTEQQQKERMKEYYDRFRKGQLTDDEMVDIDFDLDNATLGYDGADKIKVIKHDDGTASVQYTKNGVPVRTDHYGSEDIANTAAERDMFQQQLNSMNEWREDVGMELDNGTKLNIQQVYELTNDIPEGTLQQAIDGYPNMSIEEVRDRLFNSGQTSVDLVVSPDGIIRTAEQDKLIHDYYDWAKKTVDGIGTQEEAQPQTEGVYQVGQGGAPGSVTPVFQAPETPIAENGPGTEEERTYNGPTTEAEAPKAEVARPESINDRMQMSVTYNGFQRMNDIAGDAPKKSMMSADIRELMKINVGESVEGWTVVSKSEDGTIYAEKDGKSVVLSPIGGRAGDNISLFFYRPLDAKEREIATEFIKSHNRYDESYRELDDMLFNKQPIEQTEQQPEAVPAAAPQNTINENTSHGKAYSSGYNAVSANDLTTVKAIKDNHELAVRRVNNVVTNTNPVIENILSLTKQGKHAEAHALIDSTPMPEEQADALRQYIDADASMDGMQDAVEQIKDARIREYQARIEAQAQENGEDVTIIMLDGKKTQSCLVNGDLNNMSGTVMIRDLDENGNPVGDAYQVHVKNIKRVFPTQKVKDMIFAERKRIQQDIDAYFDNAVSPANFEPGKKVALKDGGSIVEATVIGVNPDGSINFQSDTGEVHTIDRTEAERMATDAKEEGYGMVLQAEAEAREAARKQAEEQQKAQAEAEARRQAEEAARKAEEERRKNPLNRLKRREDNTIDYTNSNPDDVAELLQNLGAKGKTAAYQELAKVQDAIQAAEKEASAENTPDGIDALLAQEDRQDQRNARIDELKRQEAFWMDQISRIEAREEAIRKEEEHRAAERLKREQKRQRSIAAFNKPINDARKRMADDPDAMQILEENNREPRTLKEAVADLIPKNGLVLKNWTDSYGRKHLGLEGELGMKTEDLKKLSYFVGKLENGATEIVTLAERIYENLPESLQEQAPDGSRDIRDLIIELLSEAQNADHIIHYIDNARIREAEAVYDANKAAEAEYERAMAEHNQEVENETAPTYSAEEDPFSGSAAEAPFSFRGIKTEADRQRHNKRVRKVGGLILDTESLPLEEKTKNLLDAIGRQLGKIFQVDPRVIEVDADGITQGDVIFLSPETVKNGDRFTRKISGHELTHAIKASSRDVREVWDKFLTFVQESMGKEKFNRLVDEKLSLYTDHIAEIISRRDSILKQANPSAEDLEYAQHYANLKMPTREGMMEEVASDFVGEHILTDEKFITDLVKRVEMSKADSASIIQRMRAFIDKMLAYLESLARPTSAERRARVALERARDIWADMYELVAAKQREDLIGNAEAENDVKFAIVNIKDSRKVRKFQNQMSTEEHKFDEDETKRIIEANNRFNEELKDLSNGDNHIFKLGKTGSLLQRLGFPDLDIEMPGRVIGKKAQQDYINNHPFDRSEVADLVFAINSPIMILKSKSNAGKVLLLDIKHGKKNFIAAVSLNSNIRSNSAIQINKITGLYPKDSISGILSTMESGEAEYVNENKTLRWLTQQLSDTTDLDNQQRLIPAANLVRNHYRGKNFGGKPQNPVANSENLQNTDSKNKPSFSFSARDKEYADAVAAGDMEKVDAMLREEAARKGYSDNVDYQGSLAFNGAAPSVNGYYATREERKEAYENEELDGDLSLGDMRSGISPDWLMDVVTAQERQARRRNGPHDDALLESAEALEKVMRGRKKTIKMYRAVDADIKENTFRNGDWITPSKKYAQWHTELQSWKKGRIIEQEVPIDDVWWDGNDINEWGYDDGKGYAYKNTENNRKLLEPTYDENGNLIPLSERFNEKKEDVRFSLSIKNSDPFYSNAAKATEDIKQNKATGDQWIAMLKKNGGLKAEEDKWMGLTDWLKGKKSVTKEEVEKFIADNAVKIEDVEYAEVQDIGNNPKFRQYNEEYQEIIDNADKYYDEADAEYAKFMQKMQDKYGEDWANEMDERERKLEDRLIEARDRFMNYDSGSIREIAYEVMCERYGDDFRDAFDVDAGGLTPSMDWDGNLTGQAKSFLEFDQEPINSTRLQYTTDGLENKREIALTVPTIEPYYTDEIHFGDAGEGRAVAWVRFGDAKMHDPEIKKSLDSASKELYDYLDRMSEKYETNPDHPEEIEEMRTDEEKAEHQRIMENIRKYDEANEANTKKVLVIDEIQSKRHQDAREKGYKKEIPSDAPELIAYENAQKETEQYLSMLREKYGRDDVSYGLTEGERQKLDELHDKEFKAKIDYGKFLQENKLGAFDESSVPDAPFQKTWHELALKRMLRYAAENGYDKIAWTTGEQQAERYNLREKVDEIKVANAYDTDAHEPVFTVIGRKDGGILVQEDVVGEKGMAELLGKELARKAYSNLKEGKDDYLNEDGAVVFSGDNLAIGGEGMKGFYDRMLPMFMDKYGKKWGVKTQDIELDLPNEADRVMHSVDVTPEMKESVSQGQPMFSLSDKKKTLMGVHEISEDKLRKALKLGGLANPSLGVVDTDKRTGTGFGSISLIPKSSLIDKATGRNNGTFLGDAWTPTYPSVIKFLSKKGQAHKWAIAKEVAKGDEQIENYIERAIQDYVDGNGQHGLYFLYLKQKGIEPEIKRPKIKHSHEEYEEIQKIFGEGTTTMPSRATDEQEQALLDLMMKTYEEEAREKAAVGIDEAEREKIFNNLMFVHRTIITDSDGKLAFSKGDEFVYDNYRDENKRNRNEIDWYGTDLEAHNTITRKGLSKDYEEWKESLLNDEDIEEKLYAGFDRNGYRKYLPNTVENASRLMNRESDTNAYDNGGLGATKSALLKRVSTLAAIRKNKDKLQDEETVSAKMKEASDQLFDIIEELAGMQKISDNSFSNIDYAENRLQEALTERNPVKYLNDEYGYSIEKDGEFANKIEDFIKAVDNLPAKYFETKFKRPVGFEEFAVAVVPEGTSKDVIDGLKKAGLDVRTYDQADEQSRSKVIMDAVNGRDDIKFSISPKKDKKGDIEFAYENDPKFSIRVFHGSAADFDKFDHSFMGTGEGNQSFGWGTYVTEVEGVGRNYADASAGAAIYKGKVVKGSDPYSDDPAERALFYIEQEHGADNAVKFLKQLIREEDDADTIRDYKETIKVLNDKDNWKAPERHIYQVDIPDDNGRNYLDWKSPLTEENKEDVRAGLLKDKFFRGQEQMTYDDLKSRGLDVPGFEEWLGLRADVLTTSYNGEDFYKGLSQALGGDQIASEFLRDCGFTGIKYPVNAMRGGNSEGTHNYVIFNPDDAQIVDNTKFSFRVPEGKSKAQMQAETDRDIAQRRNVVREGDTYDDVLRKAKAVRDADELVKIEQTISDNQIKPGDSFEEVLRKAEALKTAAADQQKFAFSREERARQAYERDRKRQQKEINDAQKALRKKIVDEINYLMNDQHLTVFNKSTLSRLLKDVQNADADNIEQTVTSIRTEIDRLTDKSQQRQLEDLMKLKTRDQNGKGMAIAKNVSDSVRRILGMIQGRIVDLKSTGYEEDMTQLRRQNWFLPGENMRLRRTIERLQNEEPTAERTQDMIDAEIAEAEAKIKENEAQVEANKAELADLKVRKQEAESAKALASDADVAEEIAKLMEKMDEHVAGTSTWTPSDSEKLTALQILQLKQQADGKRREIEDMKRKLAELEDSLSRYQAAARHPQRYIPRQRMEQLEQQVQGMKQAINQATDELIGQNGNLIDIVKDLVEEGKSSLVNKIQEENNRKYDILHGVITDIMGDKQIPTDQQKQKDQQQEGKLKKFFSSQLHSFEYLAKRINENSLGEDGWFYNYFVKGKNGVMQAETNHQLGLREAVETLDAKAQEIYGCSYTEASKRNAEVDNHSGVFIYRDANGMEIEEEQPLSKGQAMYIYMVWKMPDGKMKLQNQGFTDESLAQVREFLSPEDMQFADWIQDEFLKDRRAKYNDLYVELYNTSMANIENYVPLKILETEVKRDSNLSDDSGRKQTLEEKAGALIERKFNLSQVDITKNAFDVIAEHINNMEEWHAYARVRKDLDYVLSSTFVRNQLNANSAGRYNQLYDAAAIAAHAYKPNKAEHMDEVVGWLTKGLVGGNIAFRNSTALKQILSVPAFYGYCEDPKFWAALTANIGMQYVRNAPAVLANMATYGISGKAGFKLADKGKMKSLMSENIVWCMKNVPSFRNRVLKGTVGLEYMDQKLKGKVGELVDKYLDYGMATNQMIDAVTCSIGIKSIFDYRYGKLSEGIEKDDSLTAEQKAEALEEAKRQAIMDADIYYNATQQSNHSAFMSPMQLSRSMINRAFSVYQNASIGYARKAVSAGQNVYKIARNFSKLQNEYARRYMAEDANMDRDEAMDKAHEYLTHKLTHNILNAFHYGYTMNWLWDLGSKGLLGLWWWSSQRDEDKEKELRKEAGLEDNIGLRAYDIAAKAGELTTYPGRGLTGMNMASSLINGSLNNPLLLIDELDEMQQDVKKYLEDGNYAAIASQALFHGLKTSGFDARVHYNTLAGVYGMSKAALTGNQDSDFMINLMLALNTPNTNRRAVAEELYKDYPLDTYVSNIMEASKYTDNEYLALFPGMKLLTAKNQMQIYKEFAFNNLTDEEKSMLKGVTKMKLDQLRTTAELTDAYNKETDVKVKEAIGRMIIKNMKDELSKNNTPEDLLKKAKENLLGKESAAKNVIYTALCTSNDLIDDEMLKEAIADLKPVMDQLKEIEGEGTVDQEKEYTSLHKAEIDEYERLKDLQKLISEDKRDLKDATPEERIDLMNDIRQLRNEALKRGNAKDGKKEE